MADRHTAPSHDAAPARVFGLQFSDATTQQLVATMTQQPASGPQLLVTCNLDHVVNLHRNPTFRAAYLTAWQTTVDGAPVLLYQRLRGGAAQGRVTGADLFPEMMRTMDPLRHRPFFITANDAVGEALQAELEARGFTFAEQPFLTVPFGFERDAAATDAVIAVIKEFAATHLFLGIGSPKSEIWVAAHRHRLGALYILPVGAALEFHTGQKSRAPRLIRRLGLEGVWRLASEPRRLWRRYMVDSWTFLAAVREDLRR
jgi:N-acetylglucosaminyldiphosphoundecaprenol N-acetyl-beta-D-mannosaminyltransferase